MYGKTRFSCTWFADSAFTMVLEDTMRRGNGSNLLWFLAGVAAGAAVSLVVTPVSGAETRRLITKGAGNARGFLQQSGREYLEKVASCTSKAVPFS